MRSSRKWWLLLWFVVFNFFCVGSSHVIYLYSTSLQFKWCPQMDEVINFIYEYVNRILSAEGSNFKFYFKLVPSINDMKHDFCVVLIWARGNIFFPFGLSFTEHLQIAGQQGNWEANFNFSLLFSPASGKHRP